MIAWKGTISATSDAAKAAISLDDLAARTFVPDMIKIDIEGGERGALRGATRVLSERRPAFVIEVHSVSAEEICIEILHSHGYEPLIVNQRRLLADYRPIPHNRWLVAPGHDR